MQSAVLARSTNSHFVRTHAKYCIFEQLLHKHCMTIIMTHSSISSFELPASLSAALLVATSCSASASPCSAFLLFAICSALIRPAYFISAGISRAERVPGHVSSKRLFERLSVGSSWRTTTASGPSPAALSPLRVVTTSSVNSERDGARDEAEHAYDGSVQNAGIARAKVCHPR